MKILTIFSFIVSLLTLITTLKTQTCASKSVSFFVLWMIQRPLIRLYIGFHMLH